MAKRRAEQDPGSERESAARQSRNWGQGVIEEPSRQGSRQERWQPGMRSDYARQDWSRTEFGGYGEEGPQSGVGERDLRHADDIRENWHRAYGEGYRAGRGERGFEGRSRMDEFGRFANEPYDVGERYWGPPAHGREYSFDEGRVSFRGRYPEAFGQRSRFGGGPEFEMGRRNFAGRGPKGYKRSDDRICEDVCELLTRHPDVDASDIEVKVTDREVMLTGTVDDRYAKRLAEDIAEQVSGVAEVHNQIRVRTRGGENLPPRQKKRAA
jgi:hypothetical protein